MAVSRNGTSGTGGSIWKPREKSHTARGLASHVAGAEFPQGETSTSGVGTKECIRVVHHRHRQKRRSGIDRLRGLELALVDSQAGDFGLEGLARNAEQGGCACRT